MQETNQIITSVDHNKELAKIFSTMADCYKYMGPTERFRANAYENVSKMLNNMKEPIDKYDHQIKNLDKLKGVGESIAEKIIEFLDSGKIKAFEELKKNIPFELFDIMSIEGIGPGTVRLLHDRLHVDSKPELISKLKGNELKNIKGIGNKKIDLLNKGLKIYEEKKRIPFKIANEISTEFLNHIKNIPGIKDAIVAGSIRRKKETIGDIDIVLTSAKKDHRSIIDEISRLAFVDKVLVKGSTKLSLKLIKDNLQCDIRIVNENQLGAALLYFTGSKEYNIMLRSIARKKGMKINEYGVFDIKSNERLAGETEEEIFKLLHLDYVIPEKRTVKPD